MAELTLIQAVNLGLGRVLADDPDVSLIRKDCINGFIGAIMGLQPGAKALFLHAPLKTYLASIAKKGIEGRLWVRIILLNLVKEILF